MGSGVLEEAVFEPMFAAPEGSLRGKRIAHSHGWGDGRRMRDWYARCRGCVQAYADLFEREPPFSGWLCRHRR